MIHKKHVIQISLLAVFLLLSFFNISLASVELNNPIGSTNISFIIGGVINQVLGVVGAVALLVFIYGGVTWMTAMGNEQQITKGRNILTWATVGIVIIFSSYALVRLVLQAIGAP